MHYWLIRTRLLFVLSFAAGVIALPSGDRAEAQTAPDPVPLGVNLAFFKDWSTELPLVDVFHSSREWIPSAIGSAEWDSGVAVPTDANGWPLEIPYDNGGNPPQIVKTRVLHAQMTPYPTGAYTLIFEGDGVVTLDLDAFGVFEGGGSYPFQVTTPTDEDLLLTIERSNPADPVRNIHVILPGHANTWQTQPFNPLFLDAISPFSVLRFMDWIEVTGSPLVSWPDRPLLTEARQSTARGVAWEWMIALANEADADAWINIPHLADDDFVRQTARLWRDQLEPGRRVYLEYSNEPWNPDHGTYPQALWMQQRGLAIGLSTDPVTAGARFQAKRSVEVFAIFEDEWGADAGRITTLLSGWIPRLDLTEEIISSAQQTSINGVPVNTSGLQVDSLAVGMYVGWEVADTIIANGELGTIAVGEVIGRLQTELDTEVGPWTALQFDLAQSYGLDLIGYESGQYLVPNGANVENEALRDLLVAANRDERMYDLYANLIDTWEALGGGLINHYRSVWRPDHWGHLGLLEYLDQPRSEAPKYRALVDHLGAAATAPPSSTPAPANAISLFEGINLIAWSGDSTTSVEVLEVYPAIATIWRFSDGVWTADSASFPAFVRTTIELNAGTLIIVIASSRTTIAAAN